MSLRDMSFWSAKIASSKPFRQELEQDERTVQYLHITNVALEPTAADGPHTLSVEIDGGGARHETVLATLEKGKCLQYPLDFVLDATFTFKNTGKSPLHVSGYQTISSAEDFEDSDEEGEHSDEEEEAPKGVPFSSKVRATPRGTSQAGLPHAACCLPATHTAHRTSTRTLPARPPCPPQAAAAAAPARAKKKQGSDVTAKAVVAAVKKGKLPLPQLVWSPALPP